MEARDIKSEFDNATREFLSLYERTECPEARQTALLTCYARFAATFAQCAYRETLNDHGAVDPLVRCDPPLKQMLRLLKENNDRIGLGFVEFQSGCERLVSHVYWLRIGELMAETPTEGSA